MGGIAPVGACPATARAVAHAPRSPPAGTPNRSAGSGRPAGGAVRPTACRPTPRPSRGARPDPLQEFAQAPREVLHELDPLGPGAPLPHVDDHITAPPREQLPLGTEEFANAPTRPVAHHRAAGLSRCGDAQTAGVTLPGKRENHQVPSHHLEATGVDTLELRASQQLVQIAPARLKRSGACAPCAGAQPTPGAPPAFSSSPGSRGSSSAAGCSAGKSASCSHPLPPPTVRLRGARSVRPWLLPVNRTLC